MGLLEDICLVNEANLAGHSPSWFIESAKAARLRRMLKDVCAAYYRLRSIEAGQQPDKIEVEQRLAHILVQHCEDKANPPYTHSDGAYEIGLKSAKSLSAEVATRVEQIVRFRDVLARNLLEQRDEYERKLGGVRGDLLKMHSALSDKNDEILELTKLIRLKDEALLAAAERIKGQSEILSVAAGRVACKVCDVPPARCCDCQKPICAAHNRASKNNTGRCQKCEDRIPL